MTKAKIKKTVKASKPKVVKLKTIPKLKKADLVFGNLNGSGDWSMSGYKSRDGYQGIEGVLQMKPQEVIETVKASGLRGRGGAGFPTGLKWSFMPTPHADSKLNYLVCNADEGEPGTCKDRDILRHDPHTLVEGMIIGCHALQAKTGYIYVRGEYYDESSRLQQAIDEAYKVGLLGKNIKGTGVDIDIHLHLGAGAYICGEETALLESLEGKKGQPRVKPPFPANYGLYGCPTTINNVETIAQVSAIMRRGVKWWQKFGRENNYGTKIYSISGSVNKPGNFEAPLGTPLKQLIEDYAGGVIGGWDNLQAVIPGGSSTPMLSKKNCQTAIMDYDGLREFGTGLGTAAIIVMNEEVDLLAVMTRISAFYKHESCGQCTPCREGVGWVYSLMKRLSLGNGTIAEINELQELTKKIEGKTICAFADGAMWPVQGTLKHFRKLFENKIKEVAKVAKENKRKAS